MVWYRICGSIAWVGADVRLDGLCASMSSVLGSKLFSAPFRRPLVVFELVSQFMLRGVKEAFGFLLRVVTGLASSFSLGGIFRASFDEVSKRGSCAVPWYASYGFSGLLSKGLWSLCSIATVLEQSIANRQSLGISAQL
ncbi:hypothetical protein Bca4012_090394 [Brassica carinata]